MGFDNTTPWMNHHLLESVACFVNNYLDWIVILSSGYHYPPFEELGPVDQQPDMQNSLKDLHKN